MLNNVVCTFVDVSWVDLLFVSFVLFRLLLLVNRFVLYLACCCWVCLLYLELLVFELWAVSCMRIFVYVFEWLFLIGSSYWRFVQVGFCCLCFGYATHCCLTCITCCIECWFVVLVKMVDFVCAFTVCVLRLYVLLVLMISLIKLVVCIVIVVITCYMFTVVIAGFANLVVIACVAGLLI